MIRISQVKLGSVRLDHEIRQGSTESNCPSEMKNIATSYGEGRCIVMFAAACAKQIEYNWRPFN